MEKLTNEQATRILYGSLFLGCGGGGDEETGRKIIDAAIPQGVELLSISEVPEKGLFLTISPVGSPASTESHCGDETYERIIQLFKAEQKKNSELPQGEVVGLIPCEIGATSSFGPMMTSALCKIPVIDAACDGRAHPLGIMGSLGLEKLNGTVVQVGAGGNPEKNRYVEVAVVAAVDAAANIIRTSAANAGGLVEVARNPIDSDWLLSKSANSAYSFAEKIGAAFMQSGSVEDKLKAVCDVVGAECIGKGTVGTITIETKNALDYGHFEVKCDSGKSYALTFCNEYMAMDGPSGERKYTFPDFMVTCNAGTGKPISTAKLKEGDEVYLLGASRHRMILGQGLHYRAAYERLESALNIEMLKYISDIIVD